MSLSADMPDKNELESASSFVKWIVGSGTGVQGLAVASLYVVVVAGKSIPDLEKYFSPHNLSWLPPIFQCVALLPALLLCSKVGPPKALREMHKVASKACDQFRRCLTALIVVWVGFYSLVFISDVVPGLINSVGPWADFFNNMQAVFLFGCYWTMTAITIPAEPSSDERNADESMPLRLLLNYSFWVVVIFLIVDLSISSSALGRFFVQMLSGLAVGVCMALLVGCLETEYLTVPGNRFFPACFYCYAVLQLAYIGFFAPHSSQFPLETYLESFAEITSLPLKLLLIGFCYWALEEGRLAFYMEKTRKVIEDVPREWEKFSLLTATSRLAPSKHPTDRLVSAEEGRQA
jgi:hypothetical protein